MGDFKLDTRVSTWKPEDKNQFLVVYKGQTTISGGKRGQRYYAMEGDQVLNFSSKMGGSESIGMVLVLRRLKKEGQYGFVKYLGPLERGDRFYNLITEWTAVHRGKLEQENVKREAAKDHPESVKELVKQIRGNIYITELTNRERRMFALWVFEEIMKSS